MFCRLTNTTACMLLNFLHKKIRGNNNVMHFSSPMTFKHMSYVKAFCDFNFESNLKVWLTVIVVFLCFQQQYFHFNLYFLKIQYLVDLILSRKCYDQKYFKMNTRTPMFQFYSWWYQKITSFSSFCLYRCP